MLNWHGFLACFWHISRSQFFFKKKAINKVADNQVIGSKLECFEQKNLEKVLFI